MKLNGNKKLVQTTVDSDDRDELDRLAEQNNRTRADYVRVVLVHHLRLARHKKKRKR